MSEKILTKFLLYQNTALVILIKKIYLIRHICEKFLFRVNLSISPFNLKKIIIFDLAYFTYFMTKYDILYIKLIIMNREKQWKCLHMLILC